MSSKAEKDSAEDVGSAESSRPKSGKDEIEPESSGERRARGDNGEIQGEKRSWAGARQAWRRLRLLALSEKGNTEIRVVHLRGQQLGK